MQIIHTSLQTDNHTTTYPIKKRQNLAKKLNIKQQFYVCKNCSCVCMHIIVHNCGAWYSTEQF